MRLVFALALLAALGGTSLAGFKTAGTVDVTPAAKAAGGGLGAARNSADIYAEIGCLNQFENGSAVATCWAKDAAQESGLCYSTDPNIIASARSINGDSWISFSWDAAGKCTSLRVYNASKFEPKR